MTNLLPTTCKGDKFVTCNKGDKFVTCNKGDKFVTCNKGDKFVTCNKGDKFVACNKGDKFVTCNKGDKLVTWNKGDKFVTCNKLKSDKIDPRLSEPHLPIRTFNILLWILFSYNYVTIPLQSLVALWLFQWPACFLECFLVIILLLQCKYRKVAHLVTNHSELSCELSAVTSVQIIEGPLYYMILIFHFKSTSGLTSSKHANKQMITFSQTVTIMENSKYS